MTDCFNQVKTFKPETPRNADDALASSFIAGVAYALMQKYENGKMIEPEEPNAYKFEYFIFDSFEFFNQISIVRGKREEDFAPVKNKEGVDSPATASKLYNDYWRKQNGRM